MVKFRMSSVKTKFTNFNIDQNDKSVYKVRIKMHEGGILPKKYTPGSSGYDLHTYLAEPILLTPGSYDFIPTGVSIEMPDSLEVQIRPRSSATKRGLHIAFGTIDSDYRGEIKVFVHNFSKENFYIENGMRIAQLVFNIIPKTELIEVSALSSSQRGEGGFGSTGY